MKTKTPTPVRAAKRTAPKRSVREQLELAAKAGGITLFVWGAKGQENFADVTHGSQHKPWHPLRDAGDNQRLAAACCIDIRHRYANTPEHEVQAGVSGDWRVTVKVTGTVVSAVCEAVVQLAALLGEELVAQEAAAARAAVKPAGSAKPCPMCDDGDGACAFPYHGMAPHTPPAALGSNEASGVLPREDWPANFRPDPDCETQGTYTHCLHCGAGEKLHADEPVA